MLFESKYLFSWSSLTLYLQWPNKLDDGIYDWQVKENDPFEGQLDDWFSNILHLEAGSRYSNMSIALDELNKIIATPNNSCSLSKIERFSTETNIYFKYAPTPIGVPKNTSMVMRSGDGAFGKSTSTPRFIISASKK
ncbi:MAG: hypothetical protein ACJAV1_001189 [Paraglaciecola sp.]|jgi:hypothetical protein